MSIKIFVDQGHNPSGVNAGAEGNGLREQDITYMVGVYLADILKMDKNFTVKLSRNSSDESLGTSNTTSLANRVTAANEWKANYFLSIHVNANENTSINGTEMYVYKEYTESYYLAEILIKSIVNLVRTNNNYVRVRPSLYVLRKTKMPSVLIELGYITNLNDCDKLRDKQWLYAYAIYLGLTKYFGITPIVI